MKIEDIKVGDRVKYESKTGKSMRRGTVKHIFDFRKIWPEGYEREIIRIRPDRNLYRDVEIGASKLEKISKK